MISLPLRVLARWSVSGGVGVAKNINAGGDITGVAGTFSGVVTISDDTGNHIIESGRSYG